MFCDYEKSIKKIFKILGYDLKKINRQVFSGDEFQAQYQLIIKILDRTNICIFDLGAHRGQTARRYRKLFPKAKIFCFEPFPESIRELEKQFANDKNIQIVPNAVGAENTILPFYVNGLDATNSLLTRPASERRYYPKLATLKDKIDVEVITLDDFVSNSNIETIEILKFDIQGGELDALYGAKKILANKKPLLIYTEVMFFPHYENNPLFYSIWQFLSNYDYSLFNIYDLRTAKNGQLRYGNAIFVSDVLRYNVIDKFSEEP